MTLEDAIKEQYISVKKHSTEELYIYNYTSKAQYAKAWNKHTLNHRGVIKDKEGNVLYRTFPKFFNLEEVKEQEYGYSPTLSFKVYDKLDGSLGILYWDSKDEPAIATRGSFNSDQAKHATEKLLPKYRKWVDKFDKKYTYLFEIIYPQNKIVVDYGDKESLVLLAVIKTDDGSELDISSVDFPEKVKVYEGINDVEKIREILQNNTQEGVVIKFSNNYRVKIKYEEYVRLHRIVTGITPKGIWKIKMYEINPKKYKQWKGSVDEIIEKVPDEFYEWVKSIISKLNTAAKEVEDKVESAYQRIKGLERKEQAGIITTEYKDLSSYLFLKLNNKSYKESILRSLEPKGTQPFKNDEN
jgi:RNA ligase